MRRVIVVLLLAGLVIGCEDQGKQDKASEKPAATAQAKAPEKKPEPEPTAEELAAALQTEEDFEVEAATEITAENFEDELDKLEKELADG